MCNARYNIIYIGVGTYVFEIICHWLSDLSGKQFIVHNGNLNNIPQRVYKVFPWGGYCFGGSACTNIIAYNVRDIMYGNVSLRQQ